MGVAKRCKEAGANLCYELIQLIYLRYPQCKHISWQAFKKYNVFQRLNPLKVLSVWEDVGLV